MRALASALAAASDPRHAPTNRQPLPEISPPVWMHESRAVELIADAGAEFSPRRAAERAAAPNTVEILFFVIVTDMS